MRKTALFLSVFLLASTAGASSVFKRTLDAKKGRYLAQGVFIGGKAGTGFSLLNVRHRASTKLKMARVILDMGDMSGRPLHQGLGYFQVAVEKDPARVVVDLSQVSRSRLSEKKLAEIFSKSPYIKSVDFTEDPEDGSSTLVLNLKHQMAAEVYRLHSSQKPNRIVIDLKQTL